MIRSSFSQRRIYPGPQVRVPVNAMLIIPPVNPGGYMGYWPQEVDVSASGGTITVSGPGLYRIDTEGAAATDTVHTIHGGRDRMEIILACRSDVRPVTIRRSVGNIFAAADFTLATRRYRMRMVCDASLDWYETGGRSDNA